MKFLRSNVYRLYEAISYYDVSESLSPNEKDFTILLNRYFAICSFIFMFHSFCNLLFLGLTKDSVFLFSFSVLSGIIPFVLQDYRKNKSVISVFLVILSFIITYYSSFCGVESGVYLFYFPLLSCLPFFFSFKRDKNKILFLLAIILFNLYFSAFTNFNILETNIYIGTYQSKLMVLNITCILLLMVVNFFFLSEKRNDYYFILIRNALKREQINNLNTEVIRLKNLLNKEELSENKIKELINAMHLNDVIFIEKFEKFFPDFFIKLNNISSVPLSVSDFKFCAMLKLGFSTKQIAVYTNSTIKSVEGKKYRLRKKLNISSEDDSKYWISII